MASGTCWSLWADGKRHRVSDEGKLKHCVASSGREVSIYGFTKENVRRPSDQVRAFLEACVEFARQAMQEGAALLAVGDAGSSVFPDAPRPYARRRSCGDLRVDS